MPAAVKLLLIPKSKAEDKVDECNCELCSGAVRKSTKTLLRKPNRIPSGSSRTASRLRQELEAEDAPDDAPCRKKRDNIIRRNKRAVRILSKQVRAEKRLMPPCDSRYDSVRLFPTAHQALRWPPAYSMARASDISRPGKKKRGKKVEPKKLSITDLIVDRRDCACELMARAIRADLHRHLGLADRRAQINAGVTESPPPEQEREDERA